MYDHERLKESCLADRPRLLAFDIDRVQVGDNTDVDDGKSDRHTWFEEGIVDIDGDRKRMRETWVIGWRRYRCRLD